MAPKWLKKHQSLGLELGSEESVRITELVYFARAELKKGIVLFCDALDRLSKRNLPEFTVTFLGKFPGSSAQIYHLFPPLSRGCRDHGGTGAGEHWKILIEAKLTM